MIFRENTAHLIRNRRVMILAASVTTGGTVLSAIQTIHYYGGACLGACSIFSCMDACGDIPITSIFHSSQLEGYQCVPAVQCPLCKSGVKLDALVNSYGISSF
jgi:orotate phosphoribosyltransferase